MVAPTDASAGRIKGRKPARHRSRRKAAYPELSPEGSWRLVTRRAGKWEFWEKSIKDGRETLLAADESHRKQKCIGHDDGSRLIYNRSRQLIQEGSRHESSLALMPSGGGAEQTLTLPHGGHQRVGLVSRREVDTSGADHQPGRHAICVFPIAAAPQAEKQCAWSLLIPK